MIVNFNINMYFMLLNKFGMRIFTQLLTLILVFAALQFVMAQKQLVLLKKEKVILRLNPGDEFVFSLKDSKNIQRSYLNNLFDTAVMVHKTVIPFQKIDKIYFTKSNFGNVIGGLLVVGGIGYFLIDQINVVIVNGDKASLNDNVTTTSLAMVGVGLPMMLIKKKHQRIGGKYKLLTVKDGSPFYLRPLDKFEF
jgi:hypothetical protein